MRQGRLVRPRIDVYALHGGDPPLTAVVRDLQATGNVFRELETKVDPSPEGRFLYRWHVMDAGVSTPVVLWLFSHRTEIGMPGFLGSLAAIESYFMRRMVCRMTTKDYNKLFLELMAQLKDCELYAAPNLIAAFLREQTADSRLWPSDAQVREAFLTLPLWRRKQRQLPPKSVTAWYRRSAT